MDGFESFNPIAVFVYFFAAAGIAMFSMDPIILALSMLGALMFYCIRTQTCQKGTHIFSLVLFITLSLINPLFQHNGATVMFVLSDNPVTLEALLYGIAASTMIVSVLYWFRSFSDIITSDKLLYLFGMISSKLALIVSMALRYVPLFKSQAKKIDAAQKGLGLYKEDNIIDTIRIKLRVFSILITWALENGIITADSMAARGYGTGRRSFFKLYRFRRKDAALLITSLALGAAVCAIMALGYLKFDYYPYTSAINLGGWKSLAYVSYGLLALLPSLIQIGESVKWRYLRSKI